MYQPKIGELVYIETDDIQHKDTSWKRFSAIMLSEETEVHLNFRAIGWVASITERTLVLSAMTTIDPVDPAAFCTYYLPMKSITRIANVRIE